MSCRSSHVALEAAPAPPTAMLDLETYFSSLMLRELHSFRYGSPKPAEDTTPAVATEVAQPTNTIPPPATGQDDPTVPSAPAANDSVSVSAAIAEDETKRPAPAAQEPQPERSTTGPADEAADSSLGKPLKLIQLHNRTDRQRKNNGARQQRVYRLAAKHGVSPGGPRWIRGGKPYAQPAVPRSVVSDSSNTVEYNQFMYDGEGEVALRMPGGWRRHLVRSRPEFVGVAVIDGFLWPRFSPNLSRGKTVDWEEQGFVEFNEVRYTTPFVAREARPAPTSSSDEGDGILIRFDE